MAEAILDDSLELGEEVLVLITGNGTYCWPEDPASLEFYDPHRHDIVARFRREDVYQWLNLSGKEDSAIPEALRMMPSVRKSLEEDLYPKREITYQRVIASLLAMQYSAKELEELFRLADQVLDDCQVQAIKAPASHNTLGELFKQLAPVQQARLD